MLEWRMIFRRTCRLSSPWVVVLALLFVYLVLAGRLLNRFPPLNPDEVVIGVTSDSYIHGHGTNYSLYDTIFAPSAYSIRGVTTQESRIFYDFLGGVVDPVSSADARAFTVVYLKPRRRGSSGIFHVGSTSSRIFLVSGAFCLFWLTQFFGPPVASPRNISPCF